ncbi:MAG: dolichyl-phosphate mannose synthase [Phycisphaerae bacterium]|nr:MAG: dolichyl-phosphate mannose synthase [Phycisphaerae bacterium]
MSVLRCTRPYAENILAIDDGSTDDTPQLLQKFPQVATIRHETNLGYGQSLIDAFQFSIDEGYDWIITMDCDDQHEPAAIPNFVKAMAEDDADIISGSRYLTVMDGDDAPPEDRRSINLRITAMLNERLNFSITDAFCGFKAHRVSALAKLDLTEPGYAFPMQFWPQIASAGMVVRELPIRLVYNDPNRYFGGDLDNPDTRHEHYMSVFEAEMKRLRELRPSDGDKQTSSASKQTDRTRQGCCPC